MVEYIGIDIGGTNIRVGAIDKNENIIFEYKEPTFKGVATSDEFYNKIVEFIKKVPGYEQAKAIGIGVPGSVEVQTGKIITSRNVKLLIGYPLIEKLKKEFNKQVFIDNDAKTATLAEAIIGKGKEKNIVCYVTISTGFGGGVVINKKVYYGSNNLGGYFSRLILDGENTSDSLISGTALIRQVKEKLNIEIQNTKELFELYKTGNSDAKEIIGEFKKNLVAALLNISATINPDIIILGGGVMNSKEYFLDDVKETFKNKAHPLAKNTVIDITDLKEPGIIGACLLAKYH